MYISALGKGILVLNSHKAASDLLDRRGHVYSDRPRYICKCSCCQSFQTLMPFLERPVAMDIFTRGLFLGGSSYGKLCVPLNVLQCRRSTV